MEPVRDINLPKQAIGGTAEAPDAPRQPRMLHELVTGYVLQVMSALLLLAQHFLLPLALGVEAYGRLAFMTGAASLLSIAYDHGCNLLTVRKPRLAWHYLATKLAFLLVIGLVTAIWASIAHSPSPGQLLSVALHAICFVLYTFYVHADIASGHIRRVFWYALASGMLLLLTPLIFQVAGADLTYAPASASVLSLMLLFVTRGVRVSGSSPRALLRIRLNPRQLALVSVKQLQVSLGTVLDGIIVWAGVLAITSTQGYEAAGIYRIAMSMVGLMTQVLPMPKQVVLRMARQSATLSWARRYALTLIASGLAQALLVYLAALWVLGRMYPETGTAIHSAILSLSAVPAMRALLELQTVLNDRHNTLRHLIRNTCIACVTCASLYGQGVYVMVVAFYGVLTLLGLKRLLWH